VIINDTSHTPTGSLREADTYATNQLTTTLLLPAYDVSGVVWMRLSTTDTFPLANWLTYNFTQTWLLSPPDYTKTVYAQFRDADGNVSAPVSDTIILDTISPTSEIVGSFSASGGSPVTITWEGEDERSGLAYYDVQIRDATTDTWRFLLRRTVLTQTFIIGEAGHTYFFRCRATDRAGNVENWPVRTPVGGVTLDLWRDRYRIIAPLDKASYRREQWMVYLPPVLRER
jgi:hypothetical protein